MDEGYIGAMVANGHGAHARPTWQIRRPGHEALRARPWCGTPLSVARLGVFVDLPTEDDIYFFFSFLKRTTARKT